MLDIPSAIKDKAVKVIKENPVKIGCAIRKNESNNDNILTIAKLPQLSTFISFSSKENPKPLIERNSNTNPTYNGRVTIDISGFIIK